MDKVTPVKGTVHKNDTNLYYKIDSFNVITQILAEEINNNVTIEDYFYPRRIYPTILKFFTEEN